MSTDVDSSNSDQDGRNAKTKDSVSPAQPYQGAGYQWDNYDYRHVYRPPQQTPTLNQLLTNNAVRYDDWRGGGPPPFHYQPQHDGRPNMNYAQQSPYPPQYAGYGHHIQPNGQAYQQQMPQQQPVYGMPTNQNCNDDKSTNAHPQPATNETPYANGTVAADGVKERTQNGEEEEDKNGSRPTQSPSGGSSRSNTPAASNSPMPQQQPIHPQTGQQQMMPPPTAAAYKPSMPQQYNNPYFHRMPYSMRMPNNGYPQQQQQPPYGYPQPQQQRPMQNQYMKPRYGSAGGQWPMTEPQPPQQWPQQQQPQQPPPPQPPPQQQQASQPQHQGPPPSTLTAETDASSEGSTGMSVKPGEPSPAENSNSQDSLPEKGRKTATIGDPPTPASLAAPSPSPSMHEDDGMSPWTPSSNAPKISANDNVTRMFDMGDEPDRKPWLERLFAFHEERGSTITAMPCVSKQVIDLFRLYKAVKERGGLLEVSKLRKWREVCTTINIGSSGSAGFTLKKNYIKHIFPFECKFELGGIDPNPIIAKVDSLSGKKERNRQNPPQVSSHNEAKLRTKHYTRKSKPCKFINDSDIAPSGPKNEMLDTITGTFEGGEVTNCLRTVVIDSNDCENCVNEKLNKPKNIECGEGGSIYGTGSLLTSIDNKPSAPNQSQLVMPPNMAPGMPMGHGMPPNIGQNMPQSMPPMANMPPQNVPPMPPNISPNVPNMPNNTMSSVAPPASSSSVNVSNPFADTPNYSSPRPPFQQRLQQQRPISLDNQQSGEQQRPSSASSVGSQPPSTPTPSCTPQPDSASEALPSTSITQQPRPMQQQQMAGSYQPSLTPSQSYPHGGGPNSYSQPPQQQPQQQQQQQQQPPPPPSQSSYPQPMQPYPQAQQQPYNQTPQPSSYPSHPGQAPYSQTSQQNVYSQQSPMVSGYSQQQQGMYNQPSQPSQPPPPPQQQQPVYSSHMPPTGYGQQPNMYNQQPYSQMPPQNAYSQQSMYNQTQGMYSTLMQQWGNTAPPPPDNMMCDDYDSTGPNWSRHYNPNTVQRSGQSTVSSPQRTESAATSKSFISPQRPKRTQPEAFPHQSVETAQPVLRKRRRLTPKDLGGQIDPWRVIVALKSGLIGESSWALDVLNVLLRDDETVAYFSLSNLPGLVDLLLDHMRRTLIDLFPSDEDLQALEHIDTIPFAEPSIDVGEERLKVKAVTVDDETDFTQKSRDGKPVKFDNKSKRNPATQNSNNSTILESILDTNHWDSGGAEISNHIITHYESSGHQRFQREAFFSSRRARILSKLGVERTKSPKTLSPVKKEEDPLKDIRLEISNKTLDQLEAEMCEATNATKKQEAKTDTKAETKTEAKEEDNDCSRESQKVDNADSEGNRSGDRDEEKNGTEEKTIDPEIEEAINARLMRYNCRRTVLEAYGDKDALFLDDLKRTWDESGLESEAWQPDEPALVSAVPDLEQLVQRAIVLSNIIRSLSFVPGNECELCSHAGLLRLYARVLMICHRHEKEEPPIDESDAHCWWSGFKLVRENVLVTITNIAGQLKLEKHGDEVVVNLLDGLLHWAVCGSSAANDALPSLRSPSASLSPQRLMLETFAKLCVTDSNIDMLLALPPFWRLTKFVSHLVRHLSPDSENHLREMCIVIVSSLTAASTSAARLTALWHPAVPILLSFVESAEQHAMKVASSYGVNVLRDSPDMMGTSLDMLRRAAKALLNMARVPENGQVFRKYEQRLLTLVMSQILDQSVARIIADALYHTQLAERS